MCPGHFDIRPAQVEQLRRCRVLLRFDFQASLDRQLDGIANLKSVSIQVPSGMCVPANYLSAWQQVRAALESAGIAANPASTLQSVSARLAAAEAAMRRRMSDTQVADLPVIASPHQAAFCRWLGLRVVAAVGGADTASVRKVDDALDLARKSGCRLVIANRPEGTQLAQSIAERLGARMVVFDNFPDLSPRQPSFDAMLECNVARLIEAARA